MKKIITVLAILLTLFTSCDVEPIDPLLVNTETTDDNDDEGTNPNTPVLLKKVVETLPDGETEITNFFYNGTKIQKYTTTYLDTLEETVYTYSGNLITLSKYYLDGVLIETVSFEYDANLRLKKCTSTSESYVSFTDFTYNSNNTITFVTTSDNVTTANGTIYTTTDGQAYKKEIVFDPGTSFEYSEVQESFFDVKVNPFINVTGYAKIQLEMPSETLGFSGVLNNPTMFKKNNVTQDTSVYTYTTNNMPLTEVFTDLVNPDWSANFQYFYNQ